ncbi:carboxypeptidase-like regulatory domain-containing protein [Hymenobacter sp. BRD67]|uniref:carboxypeptidase-like regulatory domain-containing protein n=1 Tax=Hymenobacter sp. BRD67 TaxID=2675877 RepID=UPI001565FAE9|nr:carboxypeptidase-like regulatory domain-containing protein [Hymenobacter sp. BRD67]QKG53949.1 carboxypeptidase-like regulatory domain-containing protein [Hymenobacter sp. BRD67]
MLSGTVFEASTSKPLANVSITTTPATSGYVTDAKGQFTISQVPVGTINLTAHKSNYTDQSTSVVVSEGQTQTVSVILDKASPTTAPSAPVQPSPASGATGQPTQLTLGWHSTGAVKSDSLRYSVVLYEANSVTQRTLLTSSRDTTVTVTNLLYNSIYYWQVTVTNSAKASTRSVLWSFQTQPLPDNRFLFVRTVGSNADIYSSSSTGDNLLQLTSAATTEAAPQLSPNRDLIAYTSNATGQFQLYTMNRDGSNQRRLTTLAVEGYNNAGVGYRWSPDGAQLIYAHYNQLYRINNDGTGLLLLATAPPNRHFRECDWTAQGNRLVVQTVGVNIYDAELYLLNADGSNPTLLVGNLPGRLDSPSFSIDGSRVLYTRDVAGFDSPTGRQLDTHMFTQRLDGTNLTDITLSNGSSTPKPLGTNDLNPRYSPDGYSVLFVNQVNDGLTPGDLWKADATGTTRTKLFADVAQPDWK